MDASVIIGLKASTMFAGWPDKSSDPQNDSSEDELLVLSSFTFIFPALFRSNKNPCQCQEHHAEQPLNYSKSSCYARHQILFSENVQGSLQNFETANIDWKLK